MESLHPNARGMWDQLPDKAKAIILGGMQKSNNRQSANLHEISAYNFIQANLHELQPDDLNDTNSSLPASGERSPMGNDTGNELLVFLSKQQASNHPGHLVNILSTSASKSSQGGKYLPRTHAQMPSPANLHEIPTRISPSPPTANVINCHADHDDQPTHQTHPYLSPPLAPINCIPQLLQPTADDSFDYKSKLIKLDAAIDLMKCSWPLSTEFHHNPCNLTCTDSHQPSHPPPSKILSTYDESFDVKTQLNANDMAIEQIQQCWPMDCID